MKKSILTLLTVVFTIAIAFAGAPDKAKTKAFLMKTNRAIGVSHIMVKQKKKFTGKLGLAVRHERLAKSLYEKGELEKAVYHSARSRSLAEEILKENNAKPTLDHQFSAEEKGYLASKPSDQELDDELNKELPGDVKDEDLMANGTLGIDVK